MGFSQPHVKGFSQTPPVRKPRPTPWWEDNQKKHEAWRRKIVDQIYWDTRG